MNVLGGIGTVLVGTAVVFFLGLMLAPVLIPDKPNTAQVTLGVTGLLAWFIVIAFAIGMIITKGAWL